MQANAEENGIDVGYVARLARLDLTDAERAAFQPQLEHVVAYVRKLQELDVTGVEPLAHAVTVHNVFREDAVRPGMDPAAAMANAPESRDGLIVVPRILE